MPCIRPPHSAAHTFCRPTGPPRYGAALPHGAPTDGVADVCPACLRLKAICDRDADRARARMADAHAARARALPASAPPEPERESP